MIKNYNWVKWNQKDIQKNKEKYLEEIKKNIQKIKKIKKEDRTFENTILALDYVSGEYHNFPNFLEVMTLLSPKAEIRQEVMKVSTELEDKIFSLLRDKKLYQAILDFNQKLKKEKIKLSSEEKILFEGTLKSFQKLGFDLDKKDEKKFKNNLKKITKYSLDFQNNVAEWKDFIEIEKEDLEDLPENFRNSLKKNENGKYQISVHRIEAIPFLENSKNEKKKKELTIKMSKIGGRKNLLLLDKILKLKDENAKLLGYKNHTEFILDERMAKKPERVEKFEWDLLKKLQGQTKKEIKELTKFKEKISGQKGEIEFWNFAFYAKKFELENFAFDEEKIREYFVLEKVRQEMFNIFDKLFSIEFRKKKQKLWEKSVELFEIFDTKTKEKISEIAFDLYPRDGKHKGAFMTHIYSGFYNFDKNEYEKNAIVISANFRKPTNKIPSLLSIEEIETLFHEFGHALHGALSRAKFPSQFGTSVKWDFVETPSQFLENWVRQEKVLKKMSQHFETGKKIPQKDLDKIFKAEKFLKATGHTRQLILGILDYELHTKKIKNPEKKYLDLTQKYAFRKLNKESLFPASFSHLVGGYDAGYYSYMWALVFADDLFSEFEKNGIFDKKIGMKYRKEILEVGSSRDELESVEKFLGRKSNNKAFLKKLK